MYMSNGDIMEELYLKSGKRVKNNYADYYRNSSTWQSYIEKKRQEYESMISEEQFSSKRNRVQELTDIYFKAKKDPDSLSLAAHVLEQIRGEIEGKSSGGIQITQYNQYNAMSDEDLRKIIAENTRFLEVTNKRAQETIEAPKEPIESHE